MTDLDVVPGEGIGLDRAVVQIEGRNAYGMLRTEAGVHRLVRIIAHRRQEAPPDHLRHASRCCR